MKPIALVTGATSGIGRATAIKLSEMGYRLIIAARREDRLNDLKALLSKTTEVLSITLDVRDRKAVEESLGHLPEEWAAVEVLVNNAGLAAGLEPIQDGDPDDWDRMIDTNVKGLLYVTKAIAPGMCSRKKGHIFNLGSIAGKQVYANGNVYCASKHAVNALSQGMRIDMLPYGVKVTQICPGAVETEFSLVRFHGDQHKADNVYTGYEPLTGNDIADCIASALSLPQNICINDMVVMPKSQANSMYFYKQ
ncbi:SDR family NAD(P)-dependent oxidoreductase [Falsiporphyromonas endometrii]|uniref:SDR family NAD(P)-dependent oxidoreductase n=1 Tax=Falsiporphyromonas endometrii TaxID=1387297 RepID=A0ABV9K620_9PORP